MILDIRVTVGSVKLLIKVWLRQKERQIWKKNKWEQEKSGKIGTKERRKMREEKGGGEKRKGKKKMQ